MTHRFLPHLLVALSLVLNTGSCCHIGLPGTHTVGTQQEAGEITLSITSVERWERYSPRLAPAFDLTPQAALDAVLPATSLTEQAVYSGTTGGLGLGLPRTSKEKETVESTSAGTSTTTTTTTTNKGPGSLPTLPESAAPDSLLASLPTIPESLKTLGTDPLLRYTAAAALYQEVQLLDAYIRDAAMQRGMTPYVVRLQIGVVPYARYQPYDVYANIGFFAEGQVSKEPPQPTCKQASSAEEQPHRESGFDPRQVIVRDECPIGASLLEERGPTGEAQQAAYVVPLLVTDNLESQIASRSSETMRQIALAISALSGNVAASGTFAKQWGEIEKTLGRDVNSLLTVGRQSNNSILARLGAAHSTASRFSMVPQNHFITLLVMVPDGIVRSGCGQMRIVAKTQLRHVLGDKSNPAPDSTNERINRALRTIKEYATSRDIDEYYCPLERKSTALRSCKNDLKKQERFLAEQILRAVFANDFREFEATLCNAGLEQSYPRDLWVSIAATLGSSSTEGAQFPLPRDTFALPEKQAVVLVDDTKQNMTARLVGGADLIQDQIHAALDLPLKDGTHFPLAAVKTSIGPDGRDLTITFPSVVRLGLAVQEGPKEAKSSVRGGVLSIHRVTDQRYETAPGKCATESERPGCVEYGQVFYVKGDAKSEPPFKIRAAVEFVKANDEGKGRLTLYIEFPKKPQPGDPGYLMKQMKVTFTAMDVESATFNGSAKPPKLGSLTVPESGQLELMLRNLDESTKLKVTGEAIGADGNPIGASNLDLEIAVKPAESGTIIALPKSP
jgi:hypothetical protein